MLKKLTKTTLAATALMLGTATAIACLVSTEAMAGSRNFQTLPQGQGSSTVKPNIPKWGLSCLVRLDYKPNDIGGVYVTNNTGKALPKGTKISWTRRVGNKTYSGSKTLKGPWLSYQKSLMQTFIWGSDRVRKSCTASITGSGY